MRFIYLDEKKCREIVYKKDTLRRTGRGRNGFEMHYTKDQCSRKAKHDGYCWQHRAKAGEGRG